jgi:hypothetical protein
VTDAPRVAQYPLLDLSDLPVAADAVKCGLRLDLPKKQRRHDFRYLGVDFRTSEPGSKTEQHVAVCPRCGTERRSRV